MVIQKKIAQLRSLWKINDALLVKREQMHINDWTPKEFITGLSLRFPSTSHKDFHYIALICLESKFLYFQKTVTP